MAYSFVNFFYCYLRKEDLHGSKWEECIIKAGIVFDKIFTFLKFVALKHLFYSYQYAPKNIADDSNL